MHRTAVCLPQASLPPATRRRKGLSRRSAGRQGARVRFLFSWACPCRWICEDRECYLLQVHWSSTAGFRGKRASRKVPQFLKEAAGQLPRCLYSVYVLIAFPFGKYRVIDRSVDSKGKLQLTVF